MRQPETKTAKLAKKEKQSDAVMTGIPNTKFKMVKIDCHEESPGP